MSLLALTPAVLALSLSATALFSTAEVATPANPDPRMLLSDEYGRLEALRARLKVAEQAAEQAKEAATAARAVAPTRNPIGPRATMLAAVHLQPASGLDSAARGLTPESDWRKMFAPLR